MNDYKYIVMVRYSEIDRWVYYGIYDNKYDANRATNGLIDSKNGVDARCIHHTDYITEVELLNA
jgi:hypothetical protein